MEARSFMEAQSIMDPSLDPSWDGIVVMIEVWLGAE
jgi:hypothetical protein